MADKENFLSNRQRYQPISLSQAFSDEEMVRDWTLSETDQAEVGRYRKYSLFVAIQLCAVRLYGRFLSNVHELSPRIVNYLNSQLDQPLHCRFPPPTGGNLYRPTQEYSQLPGVSKV